MMAAAFLFLAPSLAVATEEAEVLYSNAQRQAASGQVDNAVASLQQALAAGLDGGAQRLLLDSGFDVLRGEIGFRGLTRSYVAEAPLRLVRDDEAGQRLIIRGQVLDEKGRPASAIVYIYQADALGRYTEEDPEDETHARLFGYVRSDAQGRFVVATVRPGAPPERDDLEGAARLTPERIHFQTTHWDGRAHAHLMLFEDDVRMTHPSWQGWAREYSVPVVSVAISPEGVQSCSVVLRAK
jgi:hypothetical protein